MLHFCAAIGRICLDSQFHDTVFALAKENLTTTDFTILGNFLRDTHHLKDLSRQDILEINRVLKETFSSSKIKKLIALASDDSAIKDVGMDLNLGSLEFPGAINFCATIGLTCVDRPFRLLLIDSNPAFTEQTLIIELKSNSGVHPEIELNPTEAQAVIKTLDEKAAQIAVVHNGKWIVPERNACSVGYSLEDGISTLYAPQTGALFHLLQHPKNLSFLLDNGIIQVIQNPTPNSKLPSFLL